MIGGFSEHHKPVIKQNIANAASRIVLSSESNEFTNHIAVIFFQDTGRTSGYLGSQYCLWNPELLLFVYWRAWKSGFPGCIYTLALNTYIYLGTLNTVINGKLSLGHLPDASQINANALQVSAIKLAYHHLTGIL